MMKMLIGIDEERVRNDEHYDLDDMWRIIGKTFLEYGCTAERQEDGSMLYSGTKTNDYITAIWLAIDFLEVQPWFAQYCNKWIWYDNHNDDESVLPYLSEDVLEDERAENILFKRAVH